MLFFMHKTREKLTVISSHALTPLCSDKRTLPPAPSLKSKGRGEYFNALLPLFLRGGVGGGVYYTRNEKGLGGEYV